MHFHFSEYSTPLLIGFLQGIIYGLLLLRRGFREDRLSDKLLTATLFVLCFHVAQYMLGFAGWYDSRDVHSTFMFYFPFSNLLWAGPLLYFYFRSLTNENFQFQKKDFWHFVPGIIYFTFYLWAFFADIVFAHWIMGTTLEGHFGTQGEWSQFRQRNIGSWQVTLADASFLIYGILIVMIYRQYKVYLNENHSDTGQIEFKWLRNILIAVIIAIGLELIITIFDFFLPFSYQYRWNSYLVFAILTYVLSILGYGHSTRHKQLQFDPEEPSPVEKDIVNELTPEIQSLKQRLQQLMQEEQAFLNPALTLKDLAIALKVNTSVLSKVINVGFEQNFNDFINSHRVQSVQGKLNHPDYEHLTLMGIALESGFNSKATFNRAFKKYSGMSPREYIQANTK